MKACARTSSMQLVQRQTEIEYRVSKVQMHSSQLFLTSEWQLCYFRIDSVADLGKLRPVLYNSVTNEEQEWLLTGSRYSRVCKQTFSFVQKRGQHILDNHLNTVGGHPFVDFSKIRQVWAMSIPGNPPPPPPKVCALQSSAPKSDDNLLEILPCMMVS